MQIWLYTDPLLQCGLPQKTKGNEASLNKRDWTQKDSKYTQKMWLKPKAVRCWYQKRDVFYVIVKDTKRKEEERKKEKEK